jgi:hypothetical protein
VKGCPQVSDNVLLDLAVGLSGRRIELADTLGWATLDNVLVN